MAETRVHGGVDGAEIAALGLDPAEVLDFSVNTNPYGPAPAMRAALRDAPVERYPDPTAAEARRALARAAGVGPERIVVGPGAADLLWTLARLLVRPGEAALVVEPAFSELPAAVAAAGGRVVSWRATADAGFEVAMGAVAEAARASGAVAVYLASPANPTGLGVPPPAIAALAEAVAPAVVVLDEAFLSLSERHADAGARLPGNVARVRSLTKEHAIPGVRVGYLIAPGALAARLEAARPAWSTGAPAIAAAVASVGLGAFVAESRERLLADRRGLEADLARLGLGPCRSETIFSLVPVPDGAGLRRALLGRHRILVRDCASFGLPGYVRIAARPAEERARLVEGLAAELGR